MVNKRDDVPPEYWGSLDKYHAMHSEMHASDGKAEEEPPKTPDAPLGLLNLAAKPLDPFDRIKHAVEQLEAIERNEPPQVAKSVRAAPSRPVARSRFSFQNGVFVDVPPAVRQ
jgi:hypothetical protein